MIKIKALLPILKENKRYILYEVTSKSKMSSINNYIFNELRSFLGDLGLAKAGLKFVINRGNKGILQVNNKFVDEVKTGLASIHNINNEKVNIRTLKVSGLINKVNNII